MTVLNTQIAETINITENGQYDVARYTTANVSTPVAPAHYVEKTVDANGKLINTSNLINLNGVTDVGDGALSYAHYQTSFPANTIISFNNFTTISGFSACQYCFGNTNITGLDASSLISVSGGSAFSAICKDCTSLTTIDFSSLKTITGSSAFSSAFSGCTSLTTANLSSLSTIDTYGLYNAFSGCTNLSSVNLERLTDIGSSGCYNTFNNCKQLNRIDFHSVVTIGSQGCFLMCSQAKTGITLYFPALKTANANSFQSCFQSTSSGSFHIPSNITTNFTSTNGTVYRDLPATIPLHGADSQTYDRNPRFDTSSALGWRIGNDWDTPYYTSGTTSPSVGDTIYSDSACTTAVTTISSIA